MFRSFPYAETKLTPLPPPDTFSFKENPVKYQQALVYPVMAWKRELYFKSEDCDLLMRM